MQGSDVWLNTPLRPHGSQRHQRHEGAGQRRPELSTLDGWWDEAWHDASAEQRFIGWAIGNGESYDDPD